MDTSHFKHKLEEELSLVEKELRDVASQDPETGVWSPKTGEMDTASPIAEKNEAGDAIEEFEEHLSELEVLKARWSEVKHALEKIERGSYGTCEVDGEPIEPERLEANPAARTCTTHM
jgi:RNA polymerase-binding transcription factor DksA